MRRSSPRGLAAAVVLATSVSLFACKSRTEEEKTAPTLPVVTAHDAAPPGATDAATGAAWPELDELPRATPLRQILLATRPDVPRFEVGGPVIDGELAVVSSSQLGFAAVSWPRGTLVWTKPSGTRVAPPLAHHGRFVLIGACLAPPEVPDGHLLLGCLRVVTPEGVDQAYLAIHGKARRVQAFAAAVGPQTVTSTGEHEVRWRRGDAAIAIDIVRGLARPVAADDDPVTVAYRGRTWDVAHARDGTLVARSNGKLAWATDHEITALLGSVWLPEQSPMIRYTTLSAHGQQPVVRLLDIDATGSMHGQAAWTAAPGIGLLGQAISPVGDVALAIRLDRSIQRDYIAAYAANSLLVWVYPLPQVPRVDPVGLAIALGPDRAPEAVVAFHDGDTLTVLPTLSSPPTAPGAVRGPSENATP